MTILIIIAVVILIWAVFTYNLFIRDRNRIKEAWSGIDVQLKRRSDLIPNLVTTVKGYSTHERELLEQITEKRSQANQVTDPKEKGAVETDLSSMLKRLFVVVEDYPDLKANKNFLELQSQLIEIEDTLQYARRYYNGTVRDYNIRRESFPSNLIAFLMDFKPREYFEIEFATERATPEVQI